MLSPTAYTLLTLASFSLIFGLIWLVVRQLSRLNAASFPLLVSPVPATPTPAPKARPQKCQHCKHFDLAEGAAAMSQNPAFVAATQHLTPAKMLNRPHIEGSVEIPLKAKWTDFGACLVHKEVRYQDDGCDKFEPQVEA